MTDDTLTAVERILDEALEPNIVVPLNLGSEALISVADLRALLALAKQARPEPVNKRLVECLSMWRNLVQEGGVPRYSVTPGAALNTLVGWTDAALTAVTVKLASK